MWGSVVSFGKSVAVGGKRVARGCVVVFIFGVGGGVNQHVVEVKLILNLRRSKPHFFPSYFNERVGSLQVVLVKIIVVRQL